MPQILSPFSLLDERETDIYFLPKLDFRFEISSLSILLWDDGHFPLSWGLQEAEDCLGSLPQTSSPHLEGLSFVRIHLSEMKEVFPAALERLVCF